jgi:hypothetical protein
VDGELTHFTVRVPDSAIEDVRRRSHATRWPEREAVPDWSQGVPLACLQRLCGRWADGYDWRRVERRPGAQVAGTGGATGLPDRRSRR